MKDDAATGEASTVAPAAPPAGDAAAPPDAGGGFNPLLLLVLLGIALAVSFQNYWLRRRAQGKPVLPDFLSRRSR